METLLPSTDPLPTDPQWELMATLAVLHAVSGVLSRPRRRALAAGLCAIADDWERRAAELPACGLAAARFIRPALRMVEGQA